MQKIEIEGHILRVNNAMSTFQRNVDLLIDSVKNAKREALQPQIQGRFSGKPEKLYSKSRVRPMLLCVGYAKAVTFSYK